MSTRTRETVSVSPTSTTPSRLWAVVGILAALGSFASVYLSMTLSPEYVEGRQITSEDINASLAEDLPVLIAFHVVTLTSGLLLLVFAAGLQRRLREALPPHALAPTIAFAGLLLVTVAQMLGTGLDTEFLFGTSDVAINLPSDIGFYSHWVATIPWLWVGGGVAGLAVFAAQRSAAVPGWIGVTSLLLGALTVLLGVSPLQYLAAGPGALWLLIVSVGFAAGDRAHRAGARRARGIA